MFQTSDAFAVSFGVAVGFAFGAGLPAARGAIGSTRAFRALRRHRSRVVDRTCPFTRGRRSRRGPATVLDPGPSPAPRCAAPRPDRELSAPCGSDACDPRSPQRSTAAGRTDDRTLLRLADELQEHRRRRAAHARLGEELTALDSTIWHVERDVICRGVTMPFVTFGPTGVFAFSASHEWAFTDLAHLDRVSKDLGAMLAGYPDPVRTGLYLPLDDQPARAWFDSRGQGGWIVGRGRLPGFFAHFDDRGFSAGDLAALRAHLAAPDSPRSRMRLPVQPWQG